ncbi:MAG: hypothetical protein ACJA1A_000915 [Saprospiraceae bacterium]|jgi:hypothetical protein
MKKLIQATTIILAICISTNVSYSQSYYNPFKNCLVGPSGDCIPNTLLTAMPFLRIAPDARGGAMGDVGITVTPDANSIHYNASNLAFAEKSTSLALTYTPWLRELNLNDVFLLHFSGYKKLDKLQTVGFGLRYFSLGEINFTDAQGINIGLGNPRELEFNVAYARKLGDNLSASLSAKYVYSNLASGQQVNGININSANAFAADIGVTYKKKSKLGGYDSQWTYGAAITNLGSKVSYTDQADVQDFLPANLGFGAGLLMNFDKYNSMSFHLELNKLLVPSPQSKTIQLEDGTIVANDDFDTDANGIADYREKSLFSGVFGSFGDAQGGFGEEIKEMALSFGTEYWYDKQFAVRAGYYWEHQDKGDRQYLTVGLGIQYNIFGINLSYLVPTNNRRNPLDNTLRFSLIFDFEGYQAKYAEEE